MRTAAFLEWWPELQLRSRPLEDAFVRTPGVNGSMTSEAWLVCSVSYAETVAERNRIQGRIAANENNR